MLLNLDFNRRQEVFAFFAVAVEVGLQVAKGLKRVTSNMAYCEQHCDLPTIVWKCVLFSHLVSSGRTCRMPSVSTILRWSSRQARRGQGTAGYGMHVGGLFRANERTNRKSGVWSAFIMVDVPFLLPDVLRRGVQRTRDYVLRWLVRSLPTVDTFSQLDGISADGGKYTTFWVAL